VTRKAVHDLNNYLGTISGFTDAALEDLHPGHSVYSDLEEIQQAVRKVKNIVRELDAFLKGGNADTSTENGIIKRIEIPDDELEDDPGFSRPFPPVAKPVPEYRRPSRVPIPIEPSALTKPKPKQPDTYPPPPSSSVSRESSSWYIEKSAASEKNPSTVTGTEHLFIVDDEVQLLRMFRRFFEPLGYRVTTFSDSLEARNAFQARCAEFDLAIVDQRMPDLSGANLAVEMLSIRPDLPIILLSGYTDTVSPADAARIGIRRFLSKPIPQSELNATVRSVLDERPVYST
jgi:CheY-like chemotaxis protein